MIEQQKSAIFGLNFAQPNKVENAFPITGAYDPEQQLWISEGPVQAAPTSKFTNQYCAVGSVNASYRQTSNPGATIGLDVFQDVLSDQQNDVSDFIGD